VTGGAGFLGSHIVDRLLERGDEVVVFSRSPASLPDGAVAKSGDLRNAEDVGNAIKGADVVFHTAAKAGVWGRRGDFFDINLKGTRNVLAACQQHGVKKLIHTSTPSVVFGHGDMEGVNEDQPFPDRYLTHYPASKAPAEEEVLAANGINGLLTCALRPHLIWGKGDPHLTPRVIERAKAGKLKRVGDGTNKVDITHVLDAAEAHILACDKLEEGSPVAGSAYFISSETVNLWDWVDELLKHAGLDPLIKSVSRGVAYKAGAVLEFLYSVFGLPGEPPMTRFVAENLATSHYFDITRAREHLGYEPKWTGERAFNQLFETEMAGVSHG
jgi:nucleoside-diphosphate-sugar epimerase